MRRTSVAVPLAVATLLLTGCTGTQGNGTASTSAGAPQPAPPAPGGAAGGGTGGATKADQASGSGSGDATPHLTSAVLQDRDVVFTADATVRSTDIRAAAATARRIVTGAGGVVYGEDSSLAGGDGSTVSLTFKVPPDAFQHVLDRLTHDVGDTVEVTQHAEDVTTQVVDVRSRLATQRASVERVRALLDRANTVGEVVQVEGELTRREAALESLEGQLAALQKQVALATISLHLVGPAVAVTQQPHPAGFRSGLSGGWGAFLSVVRGLLAAVGALLPFLLLVGPVALAAWLVRRRVRRARPPAPPERA